MKRSDLRDGMVVLYKGVPARIRIALVGELSVTLSVDNARKISSAEIPENIVSVEYRYGTLSPDDDITDITKVTE